MTLTRKNPNFCSKKLEITDLGQFFLNYKFLPYYRMKGFTGEGWGGGHLFQPVRCDFCDNRFFFLDVISMVSMQDVIFTINTHAPRKKHFTKKPP